MDDESSKNQLSHEVGMPLDAMSIDELQKRISLLGAEIVRVEAAIELKSASRVAADSVFKI